MDSSNVKIAIKLPNWLGDITFSMLFIKNCQLLYPNAEIELIVTDNYKSLPFLSDYKIIPYNNNPIKTGLNLRSNRYDIFFVLPLSFSSALIAFLSGAKQKVGYAHEGRNFLLNYCYKFTKIARQQHFCIEQLELLERHTHKKALLSKLSLSLDSDNQIIDKFNLTGDYIVISPFCAYGVSKEWPMIYHNKLLSKLVADGYKIIIVGSLQDRARSMVLTQDSIINLVGKTSLTELIHIIYHAKLLIALDSGNSHLGALYNVKQITLFMSTSPAWTAPYSNNAVVLHNRVECAPCFKDICPYGHYNCLHSITVDEVYKKCRALLSV